jgi:uncharacterized protein YgiB involved in biofilm formation
MNLKLRIAKRGAVLYTGAYDISDADSFAKACADAWHNLEQEQAAKEPSIGEANKGHVTSMSSEDIW